MEINIKCARDCLNGFHKDTAIYETRQGHLAEYEKLVEPKYQKVVNFVFLFSVVALTGIRVYAEGESLTRIFTTKAFQGSWEVLNKFNYVGKIMNFFTSTFCFLGLALVFMSTLVTLLYLAGKQLFDKIHSIKTGSAGGRVFGLEKLFTGVWSGSEGLGVGFDVLINFVLGFLPDIYEISEYSEGASGFGASSRKLEGDKDTIFSYVIKVTPTKILLCFFLSMGWNGTLGQAFGVCVDACGVVGEKFVTSNLDGAVARALGSMDKLKFTFGAEGTEEGKLLDKVAFSIYTSVVRDGNVTEKEDLDTVFACVERYVANSIKPKLPSMIAGKQTMDDKLYKRVDYRCNVSSNDLSTSNKGVKIPYTELGFEHTNKNIYVFFQYDGDDDVNYIQPNVKSKQEQIPVQN